METSLQAHNFCSALSLPRISSILSQPIRTQLPPAANWRSSGWLNRRSLTAVKCAKAGPVPVPELGRKWEEEMEEEEEEELMGIWRDKCKGRGIVELMECLEKEAIMGEDEGREPSDYNRRARIFDKSSRVFQALKERDASL